MCARVRLVLPAGDVVGGTQTVEEVHHSIGVSVGCTPDSTLDRTHGGIHHEVERARVECGVGRRAGSGDCQSERQCHSHHQRGDNPAEAPPGSLVRSTQHAFDLSAVTMTRRNLRVTHFGDVKPAIGARAVTHIFRIHRPRGAVRYENEISHFGYRVVTTQLDRS